MVTVLQDHGKHNPSVAGLEMVCLGLPFAVVEDIHKMQLHGCLVGDERLTEDGIGTALVEGR